MRTASLFFAFALTAADTAWTPAVSMKLRGVAEVTPSPAGDLVVWTEARAVMSAEKSEYRTHIFLARGDGSGRLQLTRGEKSATSPRFSPDGRSVFFASERSGKANLYRIPVAGGEAEQLTDWKGTIAAYAVSPDGKRVAFTGRDEDNEEEKRKKGKADWKTVEAEPRNDALFVMALDGEMPGTPRRVLKEGYHVASVAWAPDSSRIAIEHRPTPEADDVRKGDLAEVDVAGESARPIAAGPGREYEPLYSPDGRHLVYLRSPERMKSPEGERFVLLARAGGRPRDLAKTFNESPAAAGWTRDSRAVVFTEARGTRTLVYELPVDGPPRGIYTPQRGVLGALRLNAAGTHAGMVLQSAEAAPEAYVARLAAMEAPVRVSAANQGLLPVARTEMLRWKGSDGLDIEGLLTYPARYAEGARAPLILVIHGGPSGVFSETFIGNPGPYPVASFAEKGYAVLRPNPRGSTGYGHAFRQRVISDWGGLDYRDLMAGVDRAIAMGVADPQKLAVMGWSYGGYMTAWTVTQTTRFKAAAVGAGITNTVSMYGTQDVPTLFEHYFDTLPWDKPEVYARSSPIHFVSRVTTPTLILHGENDARVPPGQGYEFHRALKRRGVPVKMVVYPRMRHGLTEPKFVQNAMEQHLEWVEKWLK